MDIKDIKQIAIDYLAHAKTFVLEYCLTKTVLIGAISSIFFSVFVLFNTTPVFHVTSVVLPVDAEPQRRGNITGFAELLTSAAMEGAQKNSKFITSVRSADTAIELWDEWGLKIFNSDPKNTDPDKILVEHKFLDKLMSWIGDYDLPLYYNYLDLQDYIRDLVEIEVDMREYEIMVHMYSSNVDFTISFLDDVIRAGDTVAKKVEIRKSRAIIEALKRDLASSKNASIMSAFSDRINTEYYKIASLDNDLPYFIFVLDTPRSSPYPISPNVLFVILANLIIFTFIGIFIGFFQKNKNDLW